MTLWNWSPPIRGGTSRRGRLDLPGSSRGWPSGPGRELAGRLAALEILREREGEGPLEARTG